MVGGGLAGIAATVALADRGLRVTLVERRPRLGGRAGSFSGPDGVGLLDHSQHVLLGCCTNLLDLCERLGTRDLISFSDAYTFLDVDGTRARLAPSWWPPPLHMAPSLARFALLSAGQKWTIARGLRKLLGDLASPHPTTRTQTMADWLCTAGQPDETIDRFWRLFVVSTLNAQPEHVDSRYARLVFWESLLKNRHGHELGVPQVALAELWEPTRSRWPNVTVQTGSPVQRLHGAADRVDGVRLADGTELRADHVVVAVPPYRLATLVPPDILAVDERFQHMDRFQFNPIVAVHLWFDRAVLDEPHVHVMSPHVQWVFNVSSYRATTAPTGQYVMVVISAPDASGHDPLGKTLDELKRALPGTRRARLLRSRVIRVKRATFSPVPGVDAYRPGPAGRVANLFLAGDWTNTGWPATMEGAVRSGYACAEAVLRAEGQEYAFVRPNLPARGLARWWDQ